MKYVRVLVQIEGIIGKVIHGICCSERVMQTVVSSVESTGVTPIHQSQPPPFINGEALKQILRTAVFAYHVNVINTKATRGRVHNEI